MAQRTNHPLKTLMLLVVVAALGWGAYEFIYKRGVLRSEPSAFDVHETRKKIRTAIFDQYDADLCLHTLDEISYRANEDHIRVRLTVSRECYERAREMCREIAEIGSGVADQSLGVFAYDMAGNLLAKYVQ